MITVGKMQKIQELLVAINECFNNDVDIQPEEIEIFIDGESTGLVIQKNEDSDYGWGIATKSKS